jgi:hypothetical protein
MQQRDADRGSDEVWTLDYAAVAVAFGGDLATVGVVVREVVHEREIRDMLWTGHYVETAHLRRWSRSSGSAAGSRRSPGASGRCSGDRSSLNAVRGLWWT